MSDIRVWFEDQQPRKSNQRRILVNPKTRRPFIAKSEQANTWLAKAQALTPAHAKQGVGDPKSPLEVTFFCFYETRRPDLSIELALDALEKAGIISNDRHAYEFHAYKLFSKHVQGVYAIVRYQATPSRVTLEKWVNAGDPQLAAIADKAYSTKRG